MSRQSSSRFDISKRPLALFSDNNGSQRTPSPLASPWQARGPVPRVYLLVLVNPLFGLAFLRPRVGDACPTSGLSAVLSDFPSRSPVTSAFPLSHIFRITPPSVWCGSLMSACFSA